MSRLTATIAFLLMTVPAAWVATATPDPPQLYRVLPNSTLRQDVCVGPCACPPHFYQNVMRGSFFLTFDHSGPLFDYYRVTEINWVAELQPGPIHVGGSGVYRIGGEVAVSQQLELDLMIDFDGGPFSVHADSGLVPLDPPGQFPWIDITVISDIYVCYQTTIHLSTRPDFCPGDLDHNGGIALDDLAILLAHFGTRDGAVHEDGDIDGDGDVDLGDLARLLSHFGYPCPP